MRQVPYKIRSTYALLDTRAITRVWNGAYTRPVEGRKELSTEEALAFGKYVLVGTGKNTYGTGS